ncbi:hypothetical protein BC629DRAFT_1208306 [Irpex lacteus]|nr:hypothetical protein BC629DRAFT_1208306 [Irpex lacteus]
MSTIHTKTSSSESVSIADDGEGTTKHQVAMLGPPRPTAATVTADHSDRDDAESAASVMSGNFEANDTHNSGAPAFSNEIGASPSQGNNHLALTQDTSPQATADMQGRSIDVNSGDSQGSDVPVEEVNEDKNATNQEHTCGCQSQKLTGWAAVEKTLTDFDREEVGGCKEDIDSLLTFAGLYSGVLTAFVIVSFTQLSEDTAAESLRVLRIIANQTSGNSVSPPPTFTNPSPFQPSLAAKRVNILWFASLVISLSTASFSILVKQWLRSYMAFASSSPQGALRIRHFRRAGLEAWRVFGIASMLPFLLQISLALFFVGLCFFTADINPTIGNTTLPLVCAWAFLFIAVTLSPIFSANCPYKTPAVSPVTTTLRCYVSPLLYRWERAILSSVLQFLRRRFICMNDFSVWGPLRCWSKYLERGPLEEADVRIRESEDMAIMITADAIQANTEPDLITLESALKQSGPVLSWEETVVFLLQIIGNRVPLSADLTTRMQLPTTMIDCSLLSTRARENIVDLFQRYVINRLPDVTDLAISNSWRRLPDSESLTLRESNLLVWAMIIHISLHDEHAQLPEKLLACVDSAIAHLNLQYVHHVAGPRGSGGQKGHGHHLALATCCRIAHDNIRSGWTDKIRLAAEQHIATCRSIQGCLTVPGQ